MQVHGPCTTCDVVTDHDSSNNLSCVVNMSVTPRAKKRTSLNAVGPSVLLRRLLGFLITLDQSSFLVIYGGSYFYHVMLWPFNGVNVLMIAFFAPCSCRLTDELMCLLLKGCNGDSSWTTTGISC